MMAGLSQLKNLRKLDLGANRLRVMEDLDGLINLEELWLGKNKIEKMQNLTCLTKLRRLDVQSNRLTVIEGLESQVDTLEELYLAHNGICNQGTQGLSLKFTNLSVLDLSRNRLTDTQSLAHLTSLDELWLSGNKIDNWSQVEPLRALSSLDTIYLEYNPLQQQDPLYRKKLHECIPSLSQIDANLIGGLASQGLASTQPSGAVLSTAEELRRLQNLVIERAQAEKEGREMDS
jgi:protein phosphatase 1 regulatory subunit 7